MLVTWTIRRKLLFERVSTTKTDGREEDEPVRKYYAQFFPGRELQSEPLKHFKRDFDRTYGRRYYVIGLIFLALLSFIGLWVTAESVQSWLGWRPVPKPVPPIVISAFSGAYAWVVYDQFARFRTGDFTPYDVYAGVYRFLIAVPLGISLATFAKDQVGVAVAFLLAAFPTTKLFQIARRLLGRQLSLGESTENGKLELEKLQCMGRSNAERFLDEGITTIAELAWSNPIDLTIRTNRDLNFVIDSISQALLWVYFQDEVVKLYPLSLRGAQEACTLLEDYKSRDTKVQEAARRTLQAAAAALNLDEQTFRYTLEAVAEDPYAEFLYSVWR